MAKLTFLWYDNFGENQTHLQRNGMAAIPKRQEFIIRTHVFVYTLNYLLNQVLMQ